MSIIKFEHVSKSFGEVTPLKDIDVEIEKGDVVSIIGPSGTGKSTLLRCLIGLEPISSGKFYVNGNDMTLPGKATEVMRMKMGMVFQSFNLFEHKTVIENIMMAPVKNLKIPKQEAYDEAVKYLAMTGLSQQALEYPSQLSGGQKQRVAIIRTIATHPEILLLDEPTSALDPKMAREVASVIKLLAKSGYTILIVTHDMSLAKSVANRVLYMDEGIVYEDGTVNEIFSHPKKAKTAAFVKQLQSFCYSVKSHDFDSINALAELDVFCESSGISKRLKYATNFTFEEVLFGSLIPNSKTDEPDIEVNVSVSSNGKKVELIFDYGGEEWNALEKCDDYASTLIKHWSSGSRSGYDSKNHLYIEIE